MSLRVCIPTAGTGSRLGSQTAYLNKSLVDVAGKPVLAHIISSFPDDTEFVIALGYKGELVREFLSLAYPERKFYFAEVSPYEGPGSGLGFSLLQCAPYLQQPFLFVSCDTLVLEPVPDLDHNWAGWCERENLNSYRTLVLHEGRVTKILEKNVLAPECQAYIGMAGIADYEIFWRSMQTDEAIVEGEVCGLRGLLAAGKRVKGHRFTWYDTGSTDGLSQARTALLEKDAPTVLPKPDEAIWFVGERVIKFSANEAFIRHRVERASQLASFVPTVIGATPHMYSYSKVDGEILSRCATPSLFSNLLEHTKTFWKPLSLENEERKNFYNRCMSFYKDKTIERIQTFYDVFHKTDGPTQINGENLPSLQVLLDKIDWNMLAEGLPGRFHGDFHFENILWSKCCQKFTFLDWRQNFGGDLYIGDIYYDFAKLLHGLIVNHGIIEKNLYNISWVKNEITYDFLRKESLVRCEEIFYRWLYHNNFDVYKIKLLTSLIYLNIAPLHHYPYSLLLYAIGKYMLNNQIFTQGHNHHL